MKSRRSPITGPAEGAAVIRGDGAGDRADGQRGKGSSESALGRVDGGDGRGSLSAHFEHTVVVTRTGAEILTLLAEDAARVGRWPRRAGVLIR